MILKLSLTVLLLYYLVVLWKYYRQDNAGIDRKSTRLNSSHYQQSRMPSSA